jgi:hypothetical protein
LATQSAAAWAVRAARLVRNCLPKEFIMFKVKGSVAGCIAARGVVAGLAVTAALLGSWGSFGVLREAHAQGTGVGYKCVSCTTTPCTYSGGECSSSSQQCNAFSNGICTAPGGQCGTLYGYAIVGCYTYLGGCGGTWCQ